MSHVANPEVGCLMLMTSLGEFGVNQNPDGDQVKNGEWNDKTKTGGPVVKE